MGVLGYGSVGQYLVNAILNEETQFELAFVWNRSVEKLEADERIPREKILTDIDQAKTFSPDLIVEVCHPSIVQNYGAKILNYADLYIGSPTALADEATERKIRETAAQDNDHGVYIPCGALWGAVVCAQKTTHVSRENL